tara:strand:+ start:81 stop:470 length:390 start_codon:yes stop_codon:yes gene_type:complete
MALTPDALEHRETPVVNSNCLVIELGIGTNTDLLGTINTRVADVGTQMQRTYPTMPIGILLSANTVAILLLTPNIGPGPAPAPAATHLATGINIPIGQSLYLPISGLSATTLNYTCSAVSSVAVFFAEG